MSKVSASIPPTNPIQAQTTHISQVKAVADPYVYIRTDDASHWQGNRLHDLLKRTVGENSDELRTEQGQRRIMQDVEGLIADADSFALIHPARAAESMQGLLEMGKDLPNTEAGAEVAAAIISAVMQAIEAMGESAEMLGDEFFQSLVAFAEQFDAAGILPFGEAAANADQVTDGPSGMLKAWPDNHNFNVYPEAETALDVVRQGLARAAPLGEGDAFVDKVLGPHIDNPGSGPVEGEPVEGEPVSLPVLDESIRERLIELLEDPRLGGLGGDLRAVLDDLLSNDAEVLEDAQGVVEVLAEAVREGKLEELWGSVSEEQREAILNTLDTVMENADDLPWIGQDVPKELVSLLRDAVTDLTSQPEVSNPPGAPAEADPVGAEQPSEGQAPVAGEEPTKGTGDVEVPDTPSTPAPEPMTTAQLLERLMSDPKFAAIVAIIELAMQQKEAAQGLLNSKSGELDEKTMALYTQANKAADQLVQTATNVQKSNNDIMDTLARNV